MENPFTDKASPDLIAKAYAITVDTEHYVTVSTTRAILLSMMAEHARESDAILQTMQEFVQTVQDVFSSKTKPTTESVFTLFFEMRERVLPLAKRVDEMLSQNGLELRDEDGVSYVEAMEHTMSGL